MGKIAVAGKWETGWNAPLTEAPQWAFPLRDFEVDEWYMYPISGILHSEQSHMPLIEKPSMDEILDTASGMTRVFVEPERGVPINEFVHPENALYIFGAVATDPSSVYMREGDCAVYIPTVQNKGLLWPHQCMTIILHDRLVKQWQSQ